METNSIPTGLTDLPIINAVPPQYRKWIVLLVLFHPYIIRAYHAFASGGGIRGIAASIWLGTNVPKDVALKQDIVKAVETHDTTFLKKPTTTTDPSEVPPSAKTPINR